MRDIRTVALEAEYFTDSFCPWSWAQEPYYRKLREEFADQIRWRHRLGCTFERWPEDPNDFAGDAAEIDPAQKAKRQEQISLDTRIPIDVGIWQEDPPISAYLANLAVKAAGLQGPDLEDAYLRRVREAVFTERQPLKHIEALLELARRVPGLDPDQLRRDIKSGRARQALREDWEAARRPVPEAKDLQEEAEHIRYGYPTIVLRNASGDYRVVDGETPYEACVQVIQELEPRIQRGAPPTVEAFVNKHPCVTTKEVSVVCELPWEDAEAALERLGWHRRPVGHFCVWERR